MKSARALPPLVRAALVLLAALGFALLAWSLDRRMLGVAQEAYFGFRPVLSNALPGLLLALVLAALTRRPLFSLLVVTGLQALLYRIGTLKLQVLQDPIGLQDLYFVTNLSPDSFSLLAAYVEKPLWLLAGVVAVGTIAGLAWWLERPAFRAFRWVHAIVAVVALSLCATLFIAAQPWTGVYSKQALNPSRFKAMAGILHAGLMSNLVYSHIQNRRALDTLDEAALRRLLDTVDIQTHPVAGDALRPDIVVILSESMFDPRRLKGMAALPDAIPNVRAAIAAGHGGEMKVPTFGGGTVRTEFEVLTGMPMEAFPQAPYPYVSLVRGKVPGLVREAGRHGYRSVAIHGNAGSFWNRQSAYGALGFDRFITKDEFPKDAPRDGRYFSDSVMTDLILRELADTSTDRPALVVGISIEAHGPYRHDAEADQAERDAIPVPDGLSPERASELRDYLYHVHHADAQFGRLRDALRARARPTVVLLFGDHLPGLLDTFQKLGFVDGLSPWRQTVPYVLWRSDQPDATVRPIEAMESWMLPGQLLRIAGFDDDPYFALTNAIAARIDDASRHDRGALLRGVNAAAVARLNGSFAERLRKHRNDKGKSSK